MKFMCLCGRILSDNTDAIPYKARLIADQDWESFVDSCSQLAGYQWRLVDNVYQRPDRGYLRIEKPPGCVSFFKPENNSVSKTLFRSSENDLP